MEICPNFSMVYKNAKSFQKVNTMRKIILNFPNQFGANLNLSVPLGRREFKGVLICGMGGSALPGSLLCAWFKNKKINLPISVQRDYLLPHHINNKWLTVCVSYSGNTEETLSCYKEAKKKRMAIATISSNGKLVSLSKKYKIPHVLIPQGLPPRMALGYQFTALVNILYKTGVLKRKDLIELYSLETSLNPKKLEQKGQKISRRLIGKIPLIYASNKFKIAARIWKIAFNENTKIPAFWNYFPELNHNEMVGFQKTQKPKAQSQKPKFYFVILKDKNDNSRIKKRMDLTAKVLKKQGLKGEIINFQGKTFLEKTFNLILLAYWTSFYLANSYNIDPMPVKLVEEFKKKLNQ